MAVLAVVALAAAIVPELMPHKEPPVVVPEAEVYLAPTGWPGDSTRA